MYQRIPEPDGVSALTWKTHQGKPLEEDRVFSAPPPPEIGNVVSADSTLRRGGFKFCVAYSLGLAILSVLPLLLAATALLVLGKEGVGAKNWGSMWGLTAGIGGGLAFFGIIGLRFHDCGYVGERGVALFPLSGPGKQNLLVFDDARTLYVSSVRKHMNLIYTGTEATFTWRDRDGKAVWGFGSNYWSLNERPLRVHTIHLLRAAERSWTAWALERHGRELERTGKTGFPLASGGGIFLTPSGLTLGDSNKGTEIPWSNLNVSVCNGTLQFKDIRKSKGILSSPYSVEHSSIGNAQALLNMIQKMQGSDDGTR